MSMCAICVHQEACQAWMRHGQILYDDFEYNTDDCQQFTNKYTYDKVVRCEVCKFAEKDEIHQVSLRCTRFRTGQFIHRVLPEFFCSFGEMRIGE